MKCASVRESDRLSSFAGLSPSYGSRVRLGRVLLLGGGTGCREDEVTPSSGPWLALWVAADVDEAVELTSSLLLPLNPLKKTQSWSCGYVMTGGKGSSDLCLEVAVVLKLFLLPRAPPRRWKNVRLRLRTLEKALMF
jgi:hypothetical protein